MKEKLLNLSGEIFPNRWFRYVNDTLAKTKKTQTFLKSLKSQFEVFPGHINIKFTWEDTANNTLKASSDIPLFSDQ